MVLTIRQGRDNVHSLNTDVELAVERVDAETDERRVLGKRALGGRAANHCVFDVSEMRNADRHRTGPPPWERLVRPPIVPQQWRLSTMSLTPTTLKSAADGFDQFFSGSLGAARQVFEKNAEDPYHHLGLAVCSFLEAAMSMEVCLSHVALTDWMLMCRLPIAHRPPTRLVRRAASQNRSASPANIDNRLNHRERAASPRDWNGTF